MGTTVSSKLKSIYRQVKADSYKAMLVEYAARGPTEADEVAAVRYAKRLAQKRRSKPIGFKWPKGAKRAKSKE